MQPGEKGFTLLELLITVAITALVAVAAGSAIFQVVKAPITGTVYSLNAKIEKQIYNINRPWYSDSNWGVMVYNISSSEGIECGRAVNQIAGATNAVGAPANLTEVTFTFATTTIQKDSFYCFAIYRSYGFTYKAWIYILDKFPADTYADGNALLNNATIDSDIWMKIPIKPVREVVQ